MLKATQSPLLQGPNSYDFKQSAEHLQLPFGIFVFIMGLTLG